MNNFVSKGDQLAWIHVVTMVTQACYLVFVLSVKWHVQNIKELLIHYPCYFSLIKAKENLWNRPCICLSLTTATAARPQAAKLPSKISVLQNPSLCFCSNGYFKGALFAVAYITFLTFIQSVSLARLNWMSEIYIKKSGKSLWRLQDGETPAFMMRYLSFEEGMGGDREQGRFWEENWTDISPEKEEGF